MTSITLKKTKDKEGKPYRGLWESDVVRMEAVDAGGWSCQVPVREIGKTGYFEFRSFDLGGIWSSIGTYRTREQGCRVASKLRDGTHVLKPASRDAAGLVPARLYEWPEVSAEIANHSSTH